MISHTHLFASALLLMTALIFPRELFSQQDINSETQKNKKFFQEVEILAGGSVMYPRVLFEDEDKTKNEKFGYTIRLGLIHPVSKKLGLVMSVLLERKGLKATGIIDARSQVAGNLSNDYLTFALTPRRSIGSKSRLYVELGGYFSLLRKTSTTYVYDSAGTRRQYFDIVETVYRKYDAGIIISCGYTFPINNKKKSINIQIITSHGLVNINDFPVPHLLSMSKNSTFSIVAGIRFNN